MNRNALIIECHGEGGVGVPRRGRTRAGPAVCVWAPVAYFSELLGAPRRARPPSLPSVDLRGAKDHRGASSAFVRPGCRVRLPDAQETPAETSLRSDLARFHSTFPIQIYYDG